MLDSILFYASFLLLLILISYLFYNLYLNRKNKSYLKRLLVRFITLSGLVVGPILFMNSSYGKRLGQDYRIKYFRIDPDKKVDSIDYIKQYNEVVRFYEYARHSIRHSNRPISSFIEEDESQQILSEFEKLKYSEDSLTQDLGYLFTAFHYVNLDAKPGKVSYQLQNLHSKDISYYDYVRGTNELHKNSWETIDSAEYYLLQSISKEECVHYSYRNLAILYYRFSQDEKLELLIDNPEAAPHIPEFIKRAKYFLEFNWIEYWKTRFSAEFDYWHMFGVGSAFVLLMVWLYFLRKLDIYEPEKKRYILLTLLLSIVSMQLLYPLHDLLWHVFHYYQPTHPNSHFWYCVSSIGMIEELVKIIPVLIILRFTKEINEPFDFILYSAVSALGFFFIENIGYFGESVGNISSRGIYCSVIHMTCSATIGYGLMLSKYRGYNKYLTFILFFLLASLIHGFYDFWIMDWWASEYSWISDLTLVLCIWLFVFYTNNTLNNTTFFDEKVRMDSNSFMFSALLISIVILMTGYVTVSIVASNHIGMSYLKMKVSFLAFFILLITISFGNMKLRRGALDNLYFPVLRKWRKKKIHPNLEGLQIKLSTSNKFSIVEDFNSIINELNQSCKLHHKILIDTNEESYLLKLQSSLNIDTIESNFLIGIPHWKMGRFGNNGKVLTNLYGLKNIEDLKKPFLDESDLIYLGKVFSEKNK